MTPKIFIATPMYGGQCYGTYTNSMITLIMMLSFKGWLGTWSFLYNESLISRGRNTLVNEFLKTDYTHLLFIDSDMSFYAHDIISMIEQDKEIVSALCPKKTINWDLIASAAIAGVSPKELMSSTSSWAFLPKYDIVDIQNQKELIEIEAAGTGVLLIKREVFERLNVPFFTATNGENIKMFFECGIDKDSGLNNYLSEDYSFCRLHKQAGGKVYVAPWTKIKHTGTMIYG